MPDLFFGKFQKDRDSRFTDPIQEESQQVTSPTTPPPVPTPSSMQKFKDKVHRMNLFTAFAENPENVSFETQEADEKILVFLRKSNFLNLSWIITSIILLSVPFVLYAFRSQYSQLIPPLAFIFVLTALYYLLVTTYTFVNFLTWYYNAALITTKRIVNIDFHQLVLKEVDEAKLALVQDVSYKQDGVFENIFDFGYVLIQTAGTIDNFEFWGLPQPDRIEQIVQHLIGGRRLYEP